MFLLFIGLLLEAVEIIVSPDATLLARFYSSICCPLPRLGDGKYDLYPVATPCCRVLGRILPFLSLYGPAK